MNLKEFSDIIKVCRKNIIKPQECGVVFNGVPVNFVNLDMSGYRPVLILSDKLEDPNLPL